MVYGGKTSGLKCLGIGDFMNEESQKGHQVAAGFHKNSSDSGKILTCHDRDLLLPQGFFNKFYWYFVLCNTFGGSVSF